MAAFPPRSSSLRLVLVATLATLAVAASSAAAGDMGIEPERLITTDTAEPEQRFEAFDAVSMAIVDLDGDGSREIVTHNDNNRAYVLGARGELHAELETHHPDGWEVRELAGPAVGDLDGDGRTNVVLTNSAGWVTDFEVRYHEDGFSMAKQWETYLDPTRGDPDREWGRPGLDGPAFLADADDDGRGSVFVQLDDVPGAFKLDADGNVSEHRPHSDGNAGPLVADLTDDNSLEAVFPTDGGHVRVLDAETMDWRCEFTASEHGATPGAISVSPTLADLTGDGRYEIVFGTRHVVDDREEGWRERSDTRLFAIDADCQVLWRRTWIWNNPHVHAHPVPVDVTGNGHLDVVFQDWNTIGHSPGNWSKTGPSNLFAIQGHSGDLLWTREVPNAWSNKNLAVGDVTGDGGPEILATAFDADDGDGIGVFSLEGEREGFLPAPDGWKVSKGPVLADLEGDETQEIVVPVHRSADFCERELDVGCRAGALQIYETPSSTPAVYDNAHRFVPEDAAYDPAPDAGPPNASLVNASFERFHGNAWWVETELDARENVTDVALRVNAGPWVDLAGTGWGSWAKTLHVPEGSTVQFRVEDEDGHPELSACLTWPAAQETTCPGELDRPPRSQAADETSFSPSFVDPRGNPWWVEIGVETDRRLAEVEVRIDGDPWRPMAETDWGTWGRSSAVAEGAVVQFAASATDGTEARSDCYRWPEAEETSCPGQKGGGVGFLGVGPTAAWIEAPWRR